MEDSLPTSLLLVAGLLRLAVAPRSEPWSDDSSDRSFLEEGLATAENHLVSVREDYPVEVTLQFDSLTSDSANEGITHFHGFQRTEAQSTSEDEGRGLSILAGETKSPEPSFTDGVLLGHPTDAPVTNRPVINTGVSASKSIRTQQNHLTAFLSREERLGNATAQELSLSEKLFTSAPGKADGMDPHATTLFGSKSLDGTGQRMVLSTILSVETATSRSTHIFALGKSGTEPERHLIETIPTPGKEGMEKSVIIIPEASQQSQVTSQQAKLESRTSEVTRSPGTLTVAQKASVQSSSTHIFQEQLSEKDGATVPRTTVEQHYSSSSSPPRGEMRGHEISEPRMTEKPAFLTPAQSNAHPFPLLSTPEILSSAPFQQSSKAEDIRQSFQPQILLPSQSPLFRKSGVSSKADEHLDEGVNSILPHAVDQQTTTQTSLSKLSQTAVRESYPVDKLKKPTTEDQPNAPLLGHSIPQPPDIPPSVHGKPQVSIISTFSLPHSTSSHGRNAMSSLEASSHIIPPSPAMSVPARYSIQGIPEFQQSYELSTVHREQTSPSSLVPSFLDSEPLPISPAPIPMKPQAPGVHVASVRPDLLPPFHAELQHKSDPSGVVVALSKTTTPGNFVSPHAGLNTSAVALSASSRPRQPELSTLANGEQIRELGTPLPFQGDGQILNSIASFPTRSVSSHVEPGGPGTPSIAGLKISSPSFLDHTKTKLPPSVSISFHAKTSLLPGQIPTNSPPPSTDPPVLGEQQSSTLEMKVSPHARPQVPEGSVSVMDESHLLVPSAPAPAMKATNGTAAEGGQLVDAEPHSTGPLVFTTSIAQSLASFPHILMEHVLLDGSANPEVQPLSPNERQTPNTSSSASLQLHSFSIALLGNLRPQTSSPSALVHTEPQSLDAATSAGAGAQIPSLFTAVSPGLQAQATPLLLVTPHNPEEKSEGTSSSQTSLPTSQTGIYRMSLPGGVSLRKSPPSFASPASPVSHRSTMNFPLLSSAHVEEEAALSTRTTSTLAQRVLGFTQHLNQSGASSRDSPVVNGILGTSPSFQYLSLLVRNAENMVCLQRMQNATPVPEEQHADGHGVGSLPLSSAFGLPHLGASSLIQMSPSSVILVKPVFVFLPAETSEVPAPPSTEEEQNHEMSLSFTHKALLGLVPYASNQEQRMETRPTMSTIQHFMRMKPLSSHVFSVDEQNMSEPVLSAIPKSTETSLVESDSSTANPFPQQLREASTRTKHLGTSGQNAGIQSSTLDFPRVEGNHPVSLSVGTAGDHASISGVSPVVMPVLERPEMLPPSAEGLSISLKTSPLPSLAFQMMRSSLEASRAPGSPQLSKMLMLHTEDHFHGSMTPFTPVSKNLEESLNASSVGNMKLPLEVGHLTPPSLPSHSSLSTELLGRELLPTPSEVQYVPNEVSKPQLFPTGKEHKEVVASDDPYSKPEVAFPVARETSSHPSSLFSKLFSFHLISPKPSMAKQNPRTVPSPSALFPADPLAQTTPSGESIEDLMNHQLPSGLSTSMSSQVSTHASIAKSVTEYNPTTHQMLRRRTSLSSTGRKPEPQVSIGETNLSERDSVAHRQMEAIHITPSVSGTEPGAPSVLLVTTDFRSASVSPHDTVGSVGLQSFIQKSPPHSVLAGAAVSPLQDKTALRAGGGTFVMETPQSGLNGVLQPSVSGTNKVGFPSPSPRQDQGLKHGTGGTVGTVGEYLVRSSSHLEQASLGGENLEGTILLNDKWAQDAVSSLPSPSPVFSTIFNAPKLTTLSSGVEGLSGRDRRQRSHLHSLPLHIPESFPSLSTEAQPTPGSFEVTYNVRTEGDIFADAVSSIGGAISELSLYASEGQVALTRDPTGEGDGNGGEREKKDEEDEEEDGSVADLPPWDSDSSLLDWRAQHHRRLMRSDNVFLDGLAVVSDDACSSGNYTTEMRLHPADGGKALYSPDSFLAQIVLRDNRSHPALSVKSCCVTPTARPRGLEAASCCPFARSLVECRHVQIHQNSKSGVVNFTIQLFQMLNQSVVYLHCELSICLSQLAGCEQSCFENKEVPSKPSDRSSYETLHNVISFGPVLKTEAEFPAGPVTGSSLTVMHLTFLLLLTGTVGLMGTIAVLWVRQRHQTKMVAPPGSESP